MDNGDTCPGINNKSNTFICRVVAVYCFHNGDMYYYSNLNMRISKFNFVSLKDCHPPEMQICWHEGRPVKLLTFCLLGR